MFSLYVLEACNEHKFMKTHRKRIAISFLVLTFGLFVGFTPEKPTGVVKRIVLDAGHGGSDPGNLGTGRYKFTEKDITLDVTLRVKDYLEKEYPGIEIVLTREDDSFPTLEKRVKIANDSDADLFVSIHCDAFTKASARGSSTFVMGMHRSDEALRIAMQENASIYKEKDYQERYSFDPKDPDTYIVLTLRQNTYLDQSLQLSQNIQYQFRERVGRVDRGVRQAGYYVICFTAMPSVLVELGFLTNKEEEDFLNSEQGKSYMSSAIFRAIRDYKQEMDHRQEPELQNVGDEQVKEELRVNTTSQQSAQEVALNDRTSAKWQDCITYNDIRQGIRFQVQIATSSQKVAVEPANFNGLENIDEYFSNGLYKYAAGSTSNFDKAKEMQEILRKNGFTGAFVIAFKDGKRITLDEALNKQP